MYTLQGKPNQYAIRISCLVRVCPQTIRISHGQRIATFRIVPTRSKQALTPERNLGDQGRLTQPSSWITSFSLPRDGLRGGERGFDQVITQLHQLTRPIYQHAIGTFNTCSWGPTHRSLTDTGGGYNHLRVPPSLRLFNLNISL
jgi:hypothetical protein